MYSGSYSHDSLLFQHLPDLCSLAQPNPRQIDVEQCLPLAPRYIWRCFGRSTNTGVVHSDVDSAEGADGITDGVFDGLLFAHIHLDGFHLDVGMSSFQLIDCCSQCRGIDIRYGQALDTVSGEGPCCVLADADSLMSTILAARSLLEFLPELGKQHCKLTRNLLQ